MHALARGFALMQLHTCSAWYPQADSKAQVMSMHAVPSCLQHPNEPACVSRQGFIAESGQPSLEKEYLLSHCKPYVW
jgi:hypothetical protein